MTVEKKRQTPSQTVGPFFAYGLTPQQYGYPFKSLITSELAGEATEGLRISVIGQVLDGEGKPVNDALVEIWCPPARGGRDRGVNSERKGFARAGTGADPDTRFIFDMVKPERIGDRQAPHLNVVLTMRGLLNHLFTRIYFEDEAAANAEDPVLAKVPEDRRATLIARRTLDAGAAVYRFDIHMQGPDETVFFDV